MLLLGLSLPVHVGWAAVLPAASLSPPCIFCAGLPLQVATPSGLTNALSVLVASSSVCSILKDPQYGHAQQGRHAHGAPGLSPESEDWAQLPRLSPSPAPPLAVTSSMPVSNSHASVVANEARGRCAWGDTGSVDGDSQLLSAPASPVPSWPAARHSHGSAAFSRESTPGSAAFSREGTPDSEASMGDVEGSLESSDGEARDGPSAWHGAEASGQLLGREFGTAVDQSLLALGWLLSRCHRREVGAEGRGCVQAASAAPEQEAGQAAFGLLWKSAGLEAVCLQSPSAGAFLGRRLPVLRRALFVEWARAANPQGSGTGGGVHYSLPESLGCCSGARSGVVGAPAAAGLVGAVAVSSAASSPASCCCGSRDGTKRQAARDVHASEGEAAAADGRKRGQGSGCCKASFMGPMGMPFASGGADARACHAQVKGAQEEALCLTSTYNLERDAKALPYCLGPHGVRKHLGVPPLIPLV